MDERMSTPVGVVQCQECGRNCWPHPTLSLCPLPKPVLQRVRPLQVSGGP